MQNDNKKTDIDDEGNQLGVKQDNPSISDTINNANIAWTPGQTLPFVANIFTKSGITKTEYPEPKQESPIRKPLAGEYKITGPSTF